MHALILPGLDGTGKLLADFVEALKPGIHASVATYPSDSAMGYDELMEFVEGNFLPDGQFLLIGESFSGPIAIHLAAKLPDRVGCLVLCATFAKSPRPWFKRFRVLLDFPFPIPRNRLIDRFTMGRWITAASRDRIRTAVAGLRPAVMRKRLCEILVVDKSMELESLHCPILYLQATEDRLVPRNAWLHIHDIAPRARLAAIAGPHFLLQANPVEAAVAIHSFADTAGRKLACMSHLP